MGNIGFRSKVNMCVFTIKYKIYSKKSKNPAVVLKPELYINNKHKEVRNHDIRDRAQQGMG